MENHTFLAKRIEESFDGQASLVSDILPGGVDSNPRSLTVFNDKLYFGADSHGDDQSDIEAQVPGKCLSTTMRCISLRTRLLLVLNCHKFDGTSVQLVAEIIPGSDGTNATSLNTTGSCIFLPMTASMARSCGNMMELTHHPWWQTLTA